jgi:heat shock protein HslJ
VPTAPAGNDSATAPADAQITNILWEWQSVTDRQTGQVTTVPTPEVYTLVLYPDGTLAGIAECNSFSGEWSQDNGLIITLGATTMAACSETAMDQEYLALLGQVVAGGPDGQGGLALETAGGQQRMLFASGGPVQ